MIKKITICLVILGAMVFAEERVHANLLTRFINFSFGIFTKSADDFFTFAKNRGRYVSPGLYDNVHPAASCYSLSHAWIHLNSPDVSNKRPLRVRICTNLTVDALNGMSAEAREKVVRSALDEGRWVTFQEVIW